MKRRVQIQLIGPDQTGEGGRWVCEEDIRQAQMRFLKGETTDKDRTFIDAVLSRFCQQHFLPF